MSADCGDTALVLTGPGFLREPVCITVNRRERDNKPHLQLKPHLKDVPGITETAYAGLLFPDFTG